MLVVMAGVSEMERNLTRERTKAAMAVKRASGQRVGAIPFGYDLDSDETTLLLNEKEQGIILRINQMRRQGLTLKAIASTLTREGIPTKTGKSATWSHQVIRRILDRDEILVNSA